MSTERPNIEMAERELHQTFLRNAHLLTSEQLHSLLELVGAGEPGVALENFSQILFDNDCTLEAESIASLRRACQVMGMDSVNWKRLQRQ